MVMDSRETGDSREPALSVIIAAYRARRTIAETLQALRAQTTRERFEVIVVDSGDDGTAALVLERFPEVVLLRCPRRAHCGEARNLGLQRARAPIVAFTDADCVADPGWVDAVLAAHRAGHLAVGGAIANAVPSSWVGWGAYFTEFSSWLPGGGARTLRDIAGANASYRRALLDEHGPFLVDSYCSDTAFNWRLRRAGVTLHFTPAAVVRHRSIADLRRFLAHEIEHGRAFGRVRAHTWRWSWRRRLSQSLLGPVLPLLLLTRSARVALASATYRRPWILTSPATVLGIGCWCLGEVVGYLDRAPAPPGCPVL